MLQQNSIRIPVDLKESVDKFYIYIELPGVYFKDIKIEIKDSKILLISGNKYSKNKHLTSIYSECDYGKFIRDIHFHVPIDNKFISYLKNGILYIILNKKEDNIEYLTLNKQIEGMCIEEKMEVRSNEERAQDDFNILMSDLMSECNWADEV